MVRWLVLPVMLSAAGCNRGDIAARDAAEQASPVVQAAYQRLEAGDRDGAISSLRAVLDAHPLLARPHLDLALLLHDQRQDYIGAIYHYRRYLELQPETEKRDMIEARIVHAARAFAVEAGTLESDELPHEAVVRLERDNRRMRDVLRAQSNELATVRGELARVVVERDAAVAERDASLDAPAAPSVAAEAVADTMRGDEEASVVEQADDVRRYRVEAGDNLSSLARRFYGDATLWPRIQEANNDTLKGSVTLKPGQVLRIPGADRGGEP